MRIDHGAANTAGSVDALVAATTSAIAAAKVDLVGSAVASLYDPGRVIWAANPKQASPVTVADAIAAQAAPDPPPLSGCPTSMLFSVGAFLPGLFANGVVAFPTPPAAVFVGIVDEGGRPVSLSDCPDPVPALAADPSPWLVTGADAVPRIRIRLAWIVTPESGTAADLRARCAATPGIPPRVIDVVDPSAFLYYDPLLVSLSSRAPGLATRLDLCDSFGATGPAAVASSLSVWLSGLQLP